MKGSVSVYSYYQIRIDLLAKIDELLEQFEVKCKQFAEEQKAAMEANQDGFEGMADTFMAYKNEEVIKHFPPQYIIGKQVDEMTEVAVKEHELVTVKLMEVKNEWMYSNPTGLYNLSIPEKALRTTSGGVYVVTYEEHKRNLANDTAENVEMPTVFNWE